MTQDAARTVWKAEFKTQAVRSLSHERRSAIRRCLQSSAPLCPPPPAERTSPPSDRQASSFPASRCVFIAHLSKQKHMSGQCGSTDE